MSILPAPRGRRASAVVRALCLASAIALPASTSAAQSPVEPSALVATKTNEVLSVLEREKLSEVELLARVEESVLPHFDFERISRWVLGRHWREASEDERGRFVSAFRDMLARTYSKVLTRDTIAGVEVLATRPRADNEVMVQTAVSQSSGPGFKIDYAMYQEADTWKVFDVTVEGISLVSNYRPMFDSEIRRNGLPALIEKIVERNAQK